MSQSLKINLILYSWGTVGGWNADGCFTMNGEFELVLKKAVELDPLFIVHGGDTVFTGEIEYLQDFVRVVEKIASDIPVFVCVGNHDVPNSNPINVENFEATIGKVHWVINIPNKNFRCIAVNNVLSRTGPQKYGFTEQELFILQKHLHNNPGNTVVAMHAEPVVGRWTGLDGFPVTTPDSQRFFDLIQQHHVKKVLVSHVHAYEEQYIMKNDGTVTTGKGIDFVLSGGAGALYRRYKENEDDDEYIYEHCGSKWRRRNPRSITNWFMEQNKNHDSRLREVVRLLKMFCKSRDLWDMPGGLIQSVLADESCQSSYSRLDERFYHTIKAIKNRLEVNQEVLNPTDKTQSLSLVQKDSVRLTRLLDRLNIFINKLEKLFDETCSEKEAIDAWSEFFNHIYWSNLQEQESKRSYSELVKSSTIPSEPYFDYRETEEFIEYIAVMNIKYELNLDCNIIKDEKE